MLSYLKNVIFGEGAEGIDDTTLPPHDHIWKGLQVKKPRNATMQFKRPSSMGTPHQLHKGDISQCESVNDSSLIEASKQGIFTTTQPMRKKLIFPQA